VADQEDPPRDARNPRARTITSILMIMLAGMIIRDVIIRLLARRRRLRARCRRDIPVVVR